MGCLGNFPLIVKFLPVYMCSILVKMGCHGNPLTVKCLPVYLCSCQDGLPWEPSFYRECLPVWLYFLFVPGPTGMNGVISFFLPNPNLDPNLSIAFHFHDFWKFPKIDPCRPGKKVPLSVYLCSLAIFKKGDSSPISPTFLLSLDGLCPLLYKFNNSQCCSKHWLVPYARAVTTQQCSVISHYYVKKFRSKLSITSMSRRCSDVLIGQK